MRISDWSSDVGSSDLHVDVALGDFDGLVDEDDAHLGAHDALRLVEAAHDDAGAVVVAERRGLSRTAPVEVHEACLDGLDSHLVTENGRATCRGSGCKYVYVSVVAGSFKKQNKT